MEKNTKIVLEAKENVKWFTNEEFLGEGKSQIFIPQKIGANQIKAEGFNGIRETITIYIQELD